MFRAFGKYWAKVMMLAIFVGLLAWVWPIRFGLSGRDRVEKRVESTPILKEGRAISFECQAHWYMSGVVGVFPEFRRGMSWTTGRILGEGETQQVFKTNGDGRVVDGLGFLRMIDPVVLTHQSGLVRASFSFKWSEERRRFVTINEDVEPCITLELKRKALGGVIGFRAMRRGYSNGDKFSWPDMPPGVDGVYQWYYEEEAAGEWPGDRDGIYAIRFEGDGKPRSETLLIVKVGVGE